MGDHERRQFVIAGIIVIAGADYGVYKGVQWCKRKAAQTDPDEGIQV
ncbi:hypothetical protein RCH16_003476 [Cryobacterium sp. MP_M5]|nr:MULTISPECIES: hypothetical protein [unclassified Cryobacterium]MBG6060041.1 hypothetical protein [Cryobacterium sp. MP_M3]MEC5178437.1 hypothetical protein [Cryobacterium sp. MP_M5]